MATEIQRLNKMILSTRTSFYMSSLLSIFFTVNQVTLQLTNVKHNARREARGSAVFYFEVSL